MNTLDKIFTQIADELDTLGKTAEVLAEMRYRVYAVSAKSRLKGEITLAYVKHNEDAELMALTFQNFQRRLDGPLIYLVEDLHKRDAEGPGFVQTEMNEFDEDECGTCRDYYDLDKAENTLHADFNFCPECGRER